MASKLTKPQLRVLAHVGRAGPAATWRDACASGNLAPVYVRLADMGLITDPPFKLTDAGRLALSLGGLL